ncbi:MAG TPA: DMT family transporter [Firmicutes bacterium]|nr:DMT family transporter [Bacillota bacterium]
MQAIGASRAGIFSNLMPITTAILSYLFLHEAIGSYHLVGDCSSWWEFIWCVRYNKRPPRVRGPFGEKGGTSLSTSLGRFIDSLRNNIEN